MGAQDSTTRFEAWESRGRLVLIAVLIAALIGLSAVSAWGELRRGDMLGLLSLGIIAACAFEAFRVLKSWKAPVLVISDRTLAYQLVHFSRRRKISADEIVRLRSSTPHRVVIETRHGRNFAIWLRYLPKAKRAEARAAIERWVAAHARTDALGGIQPERP